MVTAALIKAAANRGNAVCRRVGWKREPASEFPFLLPPRLAGKCRRGTFLVVVSSNTGCRPQQPTFCLCLVSLSHVCS